MYPHIECTVHVYIYFLFIDTLKDIICSRGKYGIIITTCLLRQTLQHFANLFGFVVFINHGVFFWARNMPVIRTFRSKSKIKKKKFIARVYE